jgi:1-acyl-sn-glycerol-3-phosphate acyltransferase
MIEVGEGHTIRDIPVVGRIVTKFDSMVGVYGLQGAMRELVRRTGSRLERGSQDSSTMEILQTKPVLLICNHPHDIETFALGAALPDRDDLFFIGSHNINRVLAIILVAILFLFI